MTHGASSNRGQGPPAQWLSLPFHTPEGAWRLSWRYPEPRGVPLNSGFQPSFSAHSVVSSASFGPSSSLASPFCSHPDPSLPLTSCCSKATAVKPLDAGALGSKLRPFSSVIFFGPFFPPETARPQGGCFSSLVDGNPFGRAPGMLQSHRTGSEVAPLNPSNRLYCRTCSY